MMEISEHAHFLRVNLTYPPNRVSEPVLAELVRSYDVIPDIRRADYDEVNGGFMFLEISGETENLKRAMVFLDALSIDVNVVGMDGPDWTI